MADTPTIVEVRRLLGAALAAARDAAGLSQAELARIVSYSRSTVANVEAGRQNAAPEFWADSDNATNADGRLTKAAEHLVELITAAERERCAAERQARLHRVGLLTAERAEEAPFANPLAGMAARLAYVSDSENEEPDLEGRILDAHEHQHAGPKSLTLVGGYAGSGKSEFARFLSALTGWCVLDKDVLTRPLVEELLTAHGLDANDRHSPTYRTLVRPFEYRGLMDAGDLNLRSGISTVVTAPFIAEFADPDWLTRLANRCTGLGATLVVIWVQCDEESMRDYMRFRSAARDAWKLANWSEYMETVNPAFEPAVPHYTVDNRLNAAVALADQARGIARAVQR
jgi:predicted kinase/transcriptional regulator with XRE-family HTH domain